MVTLALLLRPSTTPLEIALSASWSYQRAGWRPREQMAAEPWCCRTDRLDARSPPRLDKLEGLIGEVVQASTRCSEGKRWTTPRAAEWRKAVRLLATGAAAYDSKKPDSSKYLSSIVRRLL